ncbi:hypothetical protein Dda_9185 [Drechslerella dactyloides]|uniref:Uncharacterized protein n=1 Tax=Drechslerella dactyloides TaxID=74499 RepID=A0AAD6IPU7_DREDA|nr:hypothetical protein Dda_9185 [Drechslerella dactyloides]
MESRKNSKPSRWRPQPEPPKKLVLDRPLFDTAWRRAFFASAEWRKLQDASVKDLFNIPLHDTPYPPRQDASKTLPANSETRDWYNFHFPTGIVLFPYSMNTIDHHTPLIPTTAAVMTTVDAPPPQQTSLISIPQLNFKRQPSDRKNSKRRDEGQSQPQAQSNGISLANFQRIQDLRRGDRVVLPDDSSIHTLNSTAPIPRGVLIINRIGTQDGTENTALQVRTFIELKLHEILLPRHIRALHVVETQTCLMSRPPPSLSPLLPGYFALKHAYLLEMEIDYWPSEAQVKAKSAIATYRLTVAYLDDNGVITIERFIAAETVHEAVNRLHVSWHVGRRARAADFIRANRWVLWLLRYVPPAQTAQAEGSGNWLEAETCQVLGWSTSGVLATGTQSVGAIQTEELTAGYRRVEEEMFSVLSRCAPLPKKDDIESDSGGE